MDKDEIDADEFLEIVASNPTCFEDFVGMPNTPETRQKFIDFIRKEYNYRYSWYAINARSY